MLADLKRQQGVQLQIIVADGGSTDASQALVEQAGATWLACKAGRARQMNAGAQQVHGGWLCFLHADSRLVDDQQLRYAIDRLSADSAPGIVAGHWALRFARRPAGRGHRVRAFFYAYMQAKTATGRRYTINGDQGVLIGQSDFRALGGFDERLPFLEDQRFAADIERVGRWQQLPGHLVTSARRFEVEGEYPRYLLMALIMAMYIVDVPAFFAQAPGVYAQQADTGRLALMPYFRLLRRMMKRCGLRASSRACWQIAGVVMGQLWQLFFLLDVAQGNHRHQPRGRWASRYEQSMARWVENPLTQAVLMICLFALLFGLVQWLAFWQERANRGRA